MSTMSYRLGERGVRCHHCGGTLFTKGQAQLNTASMSFFDLDWLNKSAWTLTCMDCSQILWFGEEPEEDYLRFGVEPETDD